MTVTGGYTYGTSSSTMNGTMCVVSRGVYTGLTKSGSGARSMFDYDAASGELA